MTNERIASCTVNKVAGKVFRRLVLSCLFALVLASCKGPVDNKVSADGTAVQTESEDSKTEKGQMPSAIEVVAAPGKKVDADSLSRLCSQLEIKDTTVYQWKNHLVVYGFIKKPDDVKNQVNAAFPGSKVNVYKKPFYEFNREQCGDTATARQWEHILLTANLVQDTVLQNEYLDHHATLKKNWPELGKGFCNAGFQQLLLYKNDRRLLLVISIPQGTTLDELNPKTTENNPRVTDWNALMEKYQEGIPGTGKGEVWVLLKKVNGQ